MWKAFFLFIVLLAPIELYGRYGPDYLDWSYKRMERELFSERVARVKAAVTDSDTLYNFKWVVHFWCRLRAVESSFKSEREPGKTISKEKISSYAQEYTKLLEKLVLWVNATDKTAVTLASDVNDLAYQMKTETPSQFWQNWDRLYEKLAPVETGYLFAQAKIKVVWAYSQTQSAATEQDKHNLLLAAVEKHLLELPQ